MLACLAEATTETSEHKKFKNTPLQIRQIHPLKNTRLHIAQKKTCFHATIQSMLPWIM